MKEQYCKTCEYWKNEQAELGYYRGKGICVCYEWKYNSTNYSDVMVLDRKNLTEYRFESTSIEIPVGRVNESRYCLVTSEEFGCIHYKKKKI